MFSLFRRTAKAYKIEACWDEEARVWYVVESDVPGLHAEAETQEELLEVLKELIPELVAANVDTSRGRQKNTLEVPIELIVHRREMLSLGH